MYFHIILKRNSVSRTQQCIDAVPSSKNDYLHPFLSQVLCVIILSGYVCGSFGKVTCVRNSMFD